MQTLKQWLIYSILFFVSIGILQAETRHIHVLKVFDNENPDYVLREGCRSIGYGIDQEIRMMANNLGILNVIEYNLSGPSFNLESLDHVLNYEMSYLERDIVIFVYVGHGFRDPGSQSPYPKLYFNGYDKSVDFVEIQERIQDKNPSLLINIVIACNVTVTDQNEPPPYQSINSAPEIVTLKAGRTGSAYEQLFENEPGVSKVVNLFSAGQEYYTFISNDGGIFFNEILYAFQEALGGKSFSGWQDICTTIEKRTSSRSSIKGISQKPFCEYTIRLSPIEVPAQRNGSLFPKSPCELSARNIRRDQRKQLKSLRRVHRSNMRDARQSRQDKSSRRLLAQEQRVQYENSKLQHEKDYQRRLQECN